MAAPAIEQYSVNGVEVPDLQDDSEVVELLGGAALLEKLAEKDATEELGKELAEAIRPKKRGRAAMPPKLGPKAPTPAEMRARQAAQTQLDLEAARRALADRLLADEKRRKEQSDARKQRRHTQRDREGAVYQAKVAKWNVASKKNKEEKLAAKRKANMDEPEVERVPVPQ